MIIVCEGCANQFESPRKKRFCGAECRKEKYVRGVLGIQKIKRVEPSVCKLCAQWFRPRHSVHNQFCCREHAFEFSRLAPHSKLKPKVLNKCEHSNGLCVGQCRLNPRPISNGRVCTECGVRFSSWGLKGGPRRTCSDECRRARERVARRAAKRVERQKRGKSSVDRAKSFGCEVSKFDQRLVFERDRWRCRLCGVATPKALRGKQHDRSPELDHIVPLSLGGAHAFENVQCACRRCNINKGAKPLGQLWLCLPPGTGQNAGRKKKEPLA